MVSEGISGIAMGLPCHEMGGGRRCIRCTSSSRRAAAGSAGNRSLTFHATAQPTLQPWPDPAYSRFENATFGRRSVPLRKSLLSTSNPVAQR